MKIIYPHYERRFTCAAEHCPDTCCAGWEITIDRVAMEKYRQAPGEFGARLRAAEDDGILRQKEGKCVFLNEAGLCEIHTRMGKEYLCDTCREFPRHVEEFENVREISLALSCPAAAGLILGCREKVRFWTREEDTPREAYRFFDSYLYEKLLKSREFLLKLLQNRTRAIEERMAAALAFAHDLQSRIRRDSLWEVEELIRRYTGRRALDRLSGKWKPYQGQMERKYELLQRMMKSLSHLRVQRERFPKQLEGYRQLLFFHGADSYAQEWEEYREYCREHSLEQSLEQLMVYFVYLYFCGGVYDRNAYAKLKLGLVSTIFIREWAVAQWIQNGKLLRPEDLVKISSSFSRELEHSDSNLNTMEYLLSQSPLFSLENLMICILN